MAIQLILVKKEGTGAVPSYINFTPSRIIGSPSPADTLTWPDYIAKNDTYIVASDSDYTAPGTGTRGRAWVYNSDGTSLLRTIDAPGTSFGWSSGVGTGALSLNANYVAVGDSQSNNVYIYDPSNGNEDRVISNPNSDGGLTTDYFGSAVAMSSTRLIVGAYQADPSGNSSGGIAYIFDPSDGSLKQTLSNPNLSGIDFFGSGVAIGETYCAVGASGEDSVSGADQGAIYIFNVSTGGLVHTLANPNVFDFNIGDSVGFSIDMTDTYLVMGAPNEDDIIAGSGGNSSGAAYVFDVATGNLLHTFVNPNPLNTSQDQFGKSVSISGTTIAIGSRGADSVGGIAGGGVYIYDAVSGDLKQTILNPTPRAGEGFGDFVEVHETTLVVRSQNDDEAASSEGAMHIYDQV